MAAIELAKELPAKEERGKTQEPRAITKDRPIVRKYASLAIWILGFLAAIYLLGFIIAPPLFIIAYLKSRAIVWLRSIVTAVLVTVSIYGVFELLLKVSLYRGIFWEMLF